MTITRRHFLITGALALSSLPTLAQLKQKTPYYIGGRKFDFYWTNSITKESNQLKLDFIGHSYIQNIVNKDQVIIVEKSGTNWCIVDLIKKEVVYKELDKNKFYYGHFTFLQGKQQLIIPYRDLQKGKLKISFLNLKNFKEEKLIASLDVESIHEVFIKNSTNILVLTTSGYLNNNMREDGVLFYNLDTDLVEKFVKMEAKYLIPTHFARVTDDEFYVAFDDVSATSKFFAREKAPPGYPGAILYYNKGKVRELNLPAELKNELRGNNSNIQYDEINKILYVSNTEGGNLFQVDGKSLDLIRNYKITSYGLKYFKNSLYISSKDKILLFKNIKDKYFFQNTHFNIIEI